MNISYIARLTKKPLLWGGLVGLLISCDAHDDHEPAVDTSMHICDIVCSDGSVVRYDDYKASKKTATAIVFYINSEDKGQGKGYAVCLDDYGNYEAFADSLGVKQGTSCSITDYDGNSNTYALLSQGRILSSIALCINEYLPYGQSAYVPSVAQMQLLYAAKSTINPYLKSCGGTELPSTPNGWYWTSTEVDGQAENKAWLFSLTSGTMQETSKLQAHRVRPIITVW